MLKLILGTQRPKGLWIDELRRALKDASICSRHIDHGFISRRRKRGPLRHTRSSLALTDGVTAETFAAHMLAGATLNRTLAQVKTITALGTLGRMAGAAQI